MARPATQPTTLDDLIRRWPAERPLACLWRTGHGTPGLIAEPTRAIRLPLDRFDELDRVLAESASLGSPAASGWIVAIPYDLGRVLEPAVDRGPPRTSPDSCHGSPMIELRRIESGFRFDHQTGRATPFGDPDPSVAADPPTLIDPSSRFELSFIDFERDTARNGYQQAVERTLEYIRAGDIYQANIAHELSARFSGSARSAFAALGAAADPWHGAYLEHFDAGSGLAIASCSPELFCEFDHTRGLIRTKPMKGTRPSHHADELTTSTKDQAELAMITDLMRNDLGRVTQLGSVRVVNQRHLEQHGSGLAQTTATIEGTLRPGTGLTDLLSATFPAGSVTGAPKIRAMQIIRELEPQPRGHWCGSIGWIGDDGSLSLNVAIRTLIVQGAAGPDSFKEADASYWVGAGIVADSDPGSEWAETLDKAGLLSHVRRSSGHGADQTPSEVAR